MTRTISTASTIAICCLILLSCFYTLGSRDALRVLTQSEASLVMGGQDENPCKEIGPDAATAFCTYSSISTCDSNCATSTCPFTCTATYNNFKPTPGSGIWDSLDVDPAGCPAGTKDNCVSAFLGCNCDHTAPVATNCSVPANVAQNTKCNGA
jgi:hypothetical protein